MASIQNSSTALMMTYTNSSDVSYNQLPLKKRLMRDINNNHVEIERTEEPCHTDYPYIASPNSVDSGFCDIEPLDLSLHSILSTCKEIEVEHVEMRGNIKSVSSMNCPKCDKVYESSARYRAHLRRHESKQSGRYRCNVCDKNFVQRSSLRTHERIHTGEKPYHCTICGDSFGDFSTFTKHRRTHTGEKPYACPICSRCFSQSGNMHRHLKVVHKPHPESLYWQTR